MKKKVIVVQRHIQNVTGIKECVERMNKKESAEILFTNDPGEVVESVQYGDSVMIVSGQVFAEAGDRSGIKYGTQLARIIKRLNPNALFFLYSTMPESDPAIDGIIPKPYGTASSGYHPLLPKILLSYRSGMIAEDLKKFFPQIM